MTWRRASWRILVSLLIVPVVGTGLFALWLQRHPDINLDTGTKCWDVFINLVSAFTAVIGGAMLLAKYIFEQIDAQAKAAARVIRELNLKEAEFLRYKLEFDKEHHQRKRALFDQAKTTAARLAHEEDPSDELTQRFDDLYLASLIGVEKPHGPVEAAMVRFERRLRKRPDAPPDSLHQLSLQLSAACEQELKESQDAIIAQYKSIADLVGGGSSPQ